MDCADCTISLDTSLAKRLKPTKCWYLYLDDCKGDWYWNGLTLLAKRLKPTKCWYLFLDDCTGDWYWNGLTLLAEWLKPTKCWHTTARVIADGLRWLHYLTRHFVSQAIETYEVLIPVSWRLQGWLILEWLDTVSRVIETYEVLIPVSWRLHWWLILEWLDTVSRVIETYEVLTHNRKGDSRWTALIALSHSTLR